MGEPVVIWGARLAASCANVLAACDSSLAACAILKGDVRAAMRRVGKGFSCPVVLRRYSAEFSAPGIILGTWSNGATGYPRLRDAVGKFMPWAVKVRRGQ